MSIHPSVLSSLPIFCAVVKHGSFSAAAKELNITQSAVSHRIKQLEKILGLSLIKRSTRFLEITGCGQRLAVASQNAILDIERTIDGIRRNNDGDDGPLNISVISAFATKWLLPNMQSYNERYLKHPISVLADERVVDLRRENVDGAVRFAASIDPDLHTTYLCGDMIVPIASPSLVSEDDIIDNPDALLKYPLLTVEAQQLGYKGYSWQNWYASQDRAMPKIKEGQKFNRTDIAMQAVMAGQGIAISRAIFMETDMLEAGLLKQVGKAIRSPHSYYFVCLPENAEKPAIVSFRNWLKEEMTKTFEKMSSALIT